MVSWGCQGQAQIWDQIWGLVSRVSQGPSGVKIQGLRPWVLGSQGWSPSIPGAAADAVAGLAGPGEHPARAPGSSGKGHQPGATTVHVEGKRAGPLEASSAHLATGDRKRVSCPNPWTPSLPTFHLGPTHSTAPTCKDPSAPALMAKVGRESRLWSPSAGNFSLWWERSCEWGK